MTVPSLFLTFCSVLWIYISFPQNLLVISPSVKPYSVFNFKFFCLPFPLGLTPKSWIKPGGAIPPVCLFNALPTSEPTVTGSLWLSGSADAHPNSAYLMVFNP